MKPAMKNKEQKKSVPARVALSMGIAAGLLCIPISAAVSLLPAQKAAAIELEDRPNLFGYPLDVADVRVPNNWQYQRTDYRFTIDIPEAAEKPLKTVTFAQIEGADYPRFSDRRSRAYEVTEEGDRPLDISVNNDWNNRTVTVTFDSPVPPGRQIKVLLNAQNPRDGVYIYEVAAVPPDTEGLGQRIGIEGLNFYQGSDRRYF